jgi:hypothetical protein
VTYTTGLYLDADLARLRFHDVPLDDFEMSIGLGNLSDSHTRHRVFLFNGA